MDGRKTIRVGDAVLDLSTPVVMTILNVTPDSFYAASRRSTDGDIASIAAEAVEAGAAIIDVGGYSSRPGAKDIDAEEEFSRVARAMDILRQHHPGVIVSVDTFRSGVARRIVENYGPVIVNDISGGELDAEMVPTVASLGVPYIAMHMRGTPGTMQFETDYDDVTDAVKNYFREKTAYYEKAGIKDVIIDPGFGFAKTVRQNYELMSRMEELVAFGYPVLSGISRKSMICRVLDVRPADALAGTVALNWESLRQGAAILRVHDTREAMDILRIFNYYMEAYAGK